MKIKPFFIGLILVLLFFLVSIFTISDYNINWDEPAHFMRGQAYLRFFLSGKKNYEGLFQPRISIYQSKTLDGQYFLENDSGHPPLNGILAALTNWIFYQKLGILGDVEAYHLFEVFISSCLVFLVFWWANQEYGLLAGLIAGLSLALYPLFFAESHNNIKDPVEAAFFAFTLYGFYKGIKHQNWKWIIFSSIFAGLALGTKFNILFAPLIILPWLGVKFFNRTLKISKAIFLSLIVYPVIVLLIFFGSWPFLWQEPVFNFIKILKYYREIGVGAVYQPPGFSLAGFNTYPIQWIFYTTPLVILFFSIIGIISCLFLFKKEKDKTSLLWLLWFLIPIFRVSVPGASIYGGARQIMEYIPAMALLAGLGANRIATLLRSHLAKIAILLMFLPIAFKMISIHPNQNLYFNPLIGGLKGAAEKNFPGWGMTLGNPYLQGVRWLNQNVEPNAKLVLSLGMMTNIPVIKLREDIEYSNILASTVLRKGEYIIGLSYHGFPVYYETQYPERYLIPVFEKKIEGVPILKIWKNDLAHTKKGFIEEKDISSETKIAIEDYGLLLDFQKPIFLTRMELFFDEIRCKEIKEGVISTSVDGISWKQETEGLLQLQIPRVKKMEKGKITHLFAALPVRYLKIEVIPHNACMFSRFKISALRDLNP